MDLVVAVPRRRRCAVKDVGQREVSGALQAAEVIADEAVASLARRLPHEREQQR